MLLLDIASEFKNRWCFTSHPFISAISWSKDFMGLAILELTSIMYICQKKIWNWSVKRPAILFMKDVWIDKSHKRAFWLTCHHPFYEIRTYLFRNTIFFVLFLAPPPSIIILFCSRNSCSIRVLSGEFISSLSPLMIILKADKLIMWGL